MKARTTSSMLWHAFAMASILILLSACGGDDSRLGSADTFVEISDSGVTRVIDQSTLYDLSISGSGNTVSIAGNNRLNQFTISGSNNIVTVLPGTTIAALTFSGADNTVNAPAGSIATKTDNGQGNSVIDL